MAKLNMIKINGSMHSEMKIKCSKTEGVRDMFSYASRTGNVCVCAV
jgi:hypothetical protein